MSEPALILAFLQNIGLPEMIVIGLVALLLFGRRLPEVGRSLGKGIVEFKKGLRDIEDDVNDRPSEPRKVLPSTGDGAKESGNSGSA